MTEMRVLRFIGWVIAIPLAALAGIWLVQDNDAPTQLVLLGFPIGSLPLGIWLLLAFLAGVLAAILASLPVLLRWRWRARRWQRASQPSHGDAGKVHRP